MNGKNVYEDIKQGVLVYWNARTGQERRFLAAGAAVVTLAVVYSLFIGPAVGGRAALRASLPQLHQEAAQLQALAAEAAELARQPAPQVTPVSRETLAAILDARAIKPESVTVTGEFVRVQVKGVQFANLVALLDQLRRESRIAAQDVNLTALGDTGLVSGTLTLRQNLGGAR